MEKKMADIHMHLIPGVDDGAMDTNMAMSLALRAYDQGIRAIVATPHSSAFDHHPEETREQFLALRKSIRPFFPDLQLYLGCEVYCEESLMDEVLSALKFKRYPSLNGTEYVLAEFSPWMPPEPAIACVKALTDAGWKPIIAHLERYVYLRERMDVVDLFRAMGALVQINTYSLFDEQDSYVKNWARQLVKEKKADFLGTDAHRTYFRPPSAQLGLSWLYENCEQAYADDLCWGNARRMLMK